MIDFLAMLFEIGAVEAEGAHWLVVYGMASFVLILCGAIAKLFLALMKKDEELRDILLQFVSEATLLSLGGGGLGVILGLVLSRLLDGRDLIGQSFQTVFSAEIAVLALVVSAVIGLFFGIYPAMRAARLHPIEALRYE